MSETVSNIGCIILCLNKKYIVNSQLRLLQNFEEIRATIFWSAFSSFSKLLAILRSLRFLYIFFCVYFSVKKKYGVLFWVFRNDVENKRHSPFNRNYELFSIYRLFSPVRDGPLEKWGGYDNPPPPPPQKKKDCPDKKVNRKKIHTECFKCLLF